ncbi:hypothetical protein [Nocardioides sp.]|uniref:hypothetical protein n=1 Tax=Nocardioides sp. TaxID=35761 RepID=UPI0037853004
MSDTAGNPPNEQDEQQDAPEVPAEEQPADTAADTEDTAPLDTAPLDTEATAPEGAEVTTELAEVEALKAEVARLRAEMPADAPAAPERTGWWRSVLVTLLVIVIAVLTPLGVVARWAHNEVADTDRYVQSVAPLASDPAVQAAMTNRITDEIVSRLQVQAVTDQAVQALADRGLPPVAASSLQALGTPLANAIEGFIHDAVAKFVASDAFQTAWEDANREAHAQLVAVLTGKDTGAVQVNGDTVSVNLATIIDAVKQQLSDRGFTLVDKLPEVNAQFTIFQSADITKAQNAFRILSAVNTWLPILLLVLLAVALAIARHRRRTLIATMIAVAASMLLLGVALNTFRMVYLDALPSDVDHAAAGAIYDTLVYFIRLNLRAILVLTLAVAFIAWVSGPGGAAVRVRRGTSRAIGSVREGGERVGLDTGQFGVFLHVNKAVIRGAVLGLALLAYVMADHPTGQFTFVVLIIAAVVLLIVELLSRPPAAPEPSPTELSPPTT